MKTMTSGFLCLALGASFPSAFALAQSATASNIPVTAKVYVPITITLTNAGLSFGDVYSNLVGGNVILDPTTDLRTSTGSLVLGTVSAVNSAAIKVGGKRNASFAITLPANGTVTLTGPGTAMAVTGFTAAVGTLALTSPFVSKLPDSASSTITFKVGGTLVVGANQSDGDYVGSFAVTVAYN